MDDLKTGQVTITTSAHGNCVQKAEMLLLPKAKLTLELSKNTVNMTVADTDILTDNLSGLLDYDTLDDMIKILVRMRNQLIKEVNG